jgi:hypothetical protein
VGAPDPQRLTRRHLANARPAPFRDGHQVGQPDVGGSSDRQDQRVDPHAEQHGRRASVVIGVRVSDNYCRKARDALAPEVPQHDVLAGVANAGHSGLGRRCGSRSRID